MKTNKNIVSILKTQYLVQQKNKAKQGWTTIFSSKGRKTAERWMYETPTNDDIWKNEMEYRLVEHSYTDRIDHVYSAKELHKAINRVKIPPLK